MIQHAIANSTGYSDLVVDPFLGSGSTLLAAEGLKRRCFGLELAPKYTDVIVRRWEGMTGEKATLESTGQNFEQVAGERNGATQDLRG